MKEGHKVTLRQLEHEPLDIVSSDSVSLRRHFALIGRCTRMYSVTSSSQDPRDKLKTLLGTDLVLKISWPEETRTSEKAIIEQAAMCDNENVRGHLPDLVWSCDLETYSTNSIRDQLHIFKPASTRRRVVRVMLFRRLHPLTELTGEAFWSAFWQCFRCKQTLPTHLYPN